MEARNSYFGPAGAVLAYLLLVSASALGQDDATFDESLVGPDAAWRATAQWDEVDEEGTREIHVHTTDPKYITPMVSYIPEDSAVPSPRDVLGYIAGTAGILTRPQDTFRYFEALADASPRVRWESMGETEEGRTMHYAIVTDEANMAKLDEYKGYTRALSDPRETSEAEALQIISTAKPIMHMTGGLHSPETGPPEMLMELAYRLAVSKHPDIENIRKNVVTLITPVTDVDGRARVVDWYYRHLESYENPFYMPSRSPPYWGKYTYHDNNRDGIQISQHLTKNYVNAYFEWHPTYSLDLHESVPLIYVSGGTGPYNPTLDPVVITEWQWVSSWEMTELNKHGLPGVWTWGFYTGWNPSYLLWVTNNHNSLGRFYETFGNSTAHTMERDLEERKFVGRSVTTKEWYRPNPPDKKVVWSLRNNTNYMQSAVLASLTLLARNGDTFLHNFWKKGYKSYRKGIDEAPHGWVIPAEQRDPSRLAYMINQLRKHGIEVHQSVTDFNLDEGEFSRGDYVVRLDQPYGNLARNLLETQEFPKDTEMRPYDDVSWTLGLHYGVETTKIDDKNLLEISSMQLVESDLDFPGAVHGGRRAIGYAIQNTGQNTLITARHMLSRFDVYAAEAPFFIGRDSFPLGSWIVPMANGLEKKLEEVTAATGLEAVALPEEPAVERHLVDLPRLALYHNWVSTQNDGWVRFTLEQAGVEFDYINDDDVRAGRLNSKYDVIMMADQGGASAKAMVHGRDPKFGPQTYTSTDEFPSHGVVDSSEDITGGIGFRGLGNLEEFLNRGGTLLLLGSSGRLATEFGLLRNVGTASGVNTPGSSVQTKVVRDDHPIAYGYEAVDHVYRVNGPVYSVPEEYEHWIVVQYGVKEREKDDGEDEDEEADNGPKPSANGKFLLSGYLTGQSTLERKGVVLDVPRNAGGRVVLYSLNPMHRYLNHHDFGLVFNAILNWNDFPDPEPEKHPGLAKD